MSRRRSARRAGWVLVLLLAGSPAAATSHDPHESGHPLRVIAYLLHPVGVAIDTVLLRPAHWLVHRADWLETLFGHEADG